MFRRSPFVSNLLPFTHGHVGPSSIGELVRVTKPGGLITISINEKHWVALDFESEVSSAGGVGPFCQKCMTNSWSGHPLEPYCECCPAGQRPLPLKEPVKDRMQKLAGIKPEKK